MCSRKGGKWLRWEDSVTGIIPPFCRSMVKAMPIGSGDCISRGTRKTGIGKAVQGIMQTGCYGDLMIMVCKWGIKYSMHMLDVSDVIVDVLEWCMKL
jgi:hypothetical protein